MARKWIITFYFLVLFSSALVSCSVYVATPTSLPKITPSTTTPTLQTRDGLPPYPTTAGWRRVHL
jgi:hypothetical protein